MKRSKVLWAIAGLLTLTMISGLVWYVVTRPDDTPAPATEKALAAVTVDVLDIKPTSYVLSGSLSKGVRINWRPFGGGPGDSNALYPRILSAQQWEEIADGCEEACDEWQVEDGVIRLRWEVLAEESDPGLFTVSLVGKKETRTIAYLGEEIHGDPRKSKTSAGLPVGVDDLVDVVTDDRFASTTTKAMVDADLAKWPEDQEREVESVPTTPAVVGLWTMQAISGDYPGPRSWREREGTLTDGSVGAELVFADHSVTADLVPFDAAQPRCGAPWTCQILPTSAKSGEIVVGRRTGEVRLWRTFDDCTLVATIGSERITDRPDLDWQGYLRSGPDLGDAGWAVDGLLVRDIDWDDSWSLTTERGLREDAASEDWLTW